MASNKKLTRSSHNNINSGIEGINLVLDSDTTNNEKFCDCRRPQVSLELGDLAVSLVG